MLRLRRGVWSAITANQPSGSPAMCRSGLGSEMVDQVVTRFGAINVLHNNAASKSADLDAFFASTEKYSLHEWRRIMSVNVDGMFLVAQAVGGQMQKQGTGGSIIQTASIYGIVSSDKRIYEGSFYLGRQISNPAVYSTSKAAVVGLTRYLAANWGDMRDSSERPRAGWRRERAKRNFQGAVFCPRASGPHGPAGRNGRRAGLSRLRRVQLCDRPLSGGRWRAQCLVIGMSSDSPVSFGYLVQPRRAECPLVMKAIARTSTSARWS